MKRHESLAPLSRDHHRVLMLAQLLKKGAPVYKGLPVTTKEKAEYAVRFFEKELKKHFLKEELVFDLVKPIDPQLKDLACELTGEHQKLESMFYSLIDNTSDPGEKMNQIGELLSRHIRSEERVFFSLVQEHCNDDMLYQISVLVGEQLAK